MSGFFSQRSAPPPTSLRYDVPETVRNRVLAILEHHIPDQRGMNLFIEQMEDLLCRQYGQLRASSYSAARRSNVPVVEHFYYCTDEQALDFIEACFRVSVQCGGQAAVDEINEVFREEGVGYELTKHLGPSTPRGGVIIGKQIPRDQLPRIIRVDHQRAHADIVVPAMSLLANPIFSVANAEMLKAHSDQRSGRREDAITACGSAFESVLKTICDQKGWAYDRNKDTCSTLVDICHKNQLFPSFYVDLFKRVGTVRNKLGDAHGRGPVPLHDVEAAHAEHMLHMTSSHIILLCRLAGLH